MTIDESLDSRYLNWLYSQIGPANNKNPERSFWLLAEQLHMKRFDWVIPNDDNRTEDGKALREEFLARFDARCDRQWLEQDCSILEMLIALSRRVEFESAHDAYHWFWTMLENLNLRVYTDAVYDDEVGLIVEKAITAVIDRRYRSNGDGGLFPLLRPNRDQRQVEIWYQMSSYLLENGYE